MRVKSRGKPLEAMDKCYSELNFGQPRMCSQNIMVDMKKVVRICCG
jgi:hypothetical protein